MQSVTDTISPQEHRGQHQHHRHVQTHQTLEEKFLEVVGHVANNVENDSGNEGGQNEAKESPLYDDLK